MKYQKCILENGVICLLNIVISIILRPEGVFLKRKKKFHLWTCKVIGSIIQATRKMLYNKRGDSL